MNRTIVQSTPEMMEARTVSGSMTMVGVAMIASLLLGLPSLSAQAANIRFHAHAGAAAAPQFPAVPAVPELPSLPPLPATPALPQPLTAARDRVTNRVEPLLEARFQAVPQVPGVNPGDLTPDQQFALAEEALRHGGPAEMGVLIGLLVPLGFFVMIVLVAWLFVRRKHALIRAQADLRKQMLDKFTSGADLAAFLESKGGQQFLAELQTYDVRPLRRGGSLSGLQGGLVCTMLGLAFLGLTLFGHHRLEVISVLLLAVGVALLLSFALSQRLSRDSTPGTASGPGSGSRPGSYPGSGAPSGSASGSGPILPA